MSLFKKVEKKNTKREKIALEHQDDLLKEERKVEKRKMRNVEEEKKQIEKIKTEKKAARTTTVAKNTRADTTKEIKSR